MPAFAPSVLEEIINHQQIRLLPALHGGSRMTRNRGSMTFYDASLFAAFLEVFGHCFSWAATTAALKLGQSRKYEIAKAKMATITSSKLKWISAGAVRATSRFPIRRERETETTTAASNSHRSGVLENASLASRLRSPFGIAQYFYFVVMV